MSRRLIGVLAIPAVVGIGLAVWLFNHHGPYHPGDWIWPWPAPLFAALAIDALIATAGLGRHTSWAGRVGLAGLFFVGLLGLALYGPIVVSEPSVPGDISGL